MDLRERRRSNFHCGPPFTTICEMDGNRDIFVRTLAILCLESQFTQPHVTFLSFDKNGVRIVRNVTFCNRSP